MAVVIAERPRFQQPLAPRVKEIVSYAVSRVSQGLRRLAFADESQKQQGNQKPAENKSPISGITNTDKGSPMRTSGSREEAKKVVEEKTKNK